MIRRILAPAVAMVGALALCTLAPTGPAQAEESPGAESFGLIDDEFKCLQLVPELTSFENKPVALRLRILLDGTPKDRAEAAVEVMRKTYAALDIDVRATYRKVTFEGTDALALIGQSKKVYRGKVPRGVDVVYTLTNKDIVGGFPAGKNVAGLADCIGGVRFPAHAFAVGEIFPESVKSQTLPVTLADATGKTMAHEVGHLLGAHHHYASVEGYSGTGPDVLSLMGPSLSVIGLRFSSLEAAVVRGHVQRSR